MIKSAGGGGGADGKSNNSLKDDSSDTAENQTTAVCVDSSDQKTMKSAGGGGADGKSNNSDVPSDTVENQVDAEGAPAEEQETTAVCVDSPDQKMMKSAGGGGGADGKSNNSAITVFSPGSPFGDSATTENKSTEQNKAWCLGGIYMSLQKFLVQQNLKTYQVGTEAQMLKAREKTVAFANGVGIDPSQVILVQTDDKLKAARYITKQVKYRETAHCAKAGDHVTFNPSNRKTKINGVLVYVPLPTGQFAIKKLPGVP